MPDDVKVGTRGDGQEGDPDGPDGFEEESHEETEPTPPDELEDLLTFLGDEADYVRVYHFNEGKREYLERIGADGFSFDRVRDEYGPGKYEGVVIGGGGKIAGQRRFEIAERPGRGPQGDRGAPQGPEAPRVEVHPDPALQEPAGSVLEGLRRIEWGLRDLRNPPAAAQQANPAAMAVELATAMHAASQPLMKTMLDMMKDRRQEEGAEELSTLRAFMEGVQFMREMGGNSGESGGDRWATLADRILMPLVAKLQDTPSYGGSMTENPPAGAATGPAWAQELGPWISQLIPLARAGKNPELYAELAYDSMDAEQWARLMGHVTEGDTFETEFFALFPAAKPSRPWFQTLFETLRAIHAETSEAAETPAPGGSDNGRGGGHVGGGPPGGGGSV